MTLLKLIVLAASLSSFVFANMAPSYPEPGTVWNAGQEYDISWDDDSELPKLSQGWTKFKIDFMTGDNNDQKFLKNVAENLDGSKIQKFRWVAPEVEPHAAVYFFMFTNDKGENAWTTRFGIAGPDGKLVKPEYTKQPDGSEIPWGVGKLVESNTTSIIAQEAKATDAVASAEVSTEATQVEATQAEAKASSSLEINPALSSVVDKSLPAEVQITNSAKIHLPSAFLIGTLSLIGYLFQN